MYKECWNRRICLSGWLKRWQLDIWEETKVERAIVVMERLEGKTSQCVRAVILRTWSNAWCTGRRFQLWGQWIVGSRCSLDNLDAIEHYTICPQIQKWSTRWLGRSLQGTLKDKRRIALLLDGQFTTDIDLTLDAIRLASIHWVHNKCKHDGRCNPHERINMMTQAAYDLAEGNSYSMRCIHNYQRS